MKKQSLFGIPSSQLLAAASLAIAASLFATTSTAQSAVPTAPPMLPGLWQITSKPQMSGLMVPAAPKIEKRCLTAEAIREGKIPMHALPACTVTGGTWDGPKLTAKVDCKNALPDVALTSVEVVAKDTSFEGLIRVTLVPNAAQEAEQGRINYDQSGQRLSDTCTP